MNEAWILSDETGEMNHEPPAEVRDIKEQVGMLSPDGTTVGWGTFVAPDGQEWLHGTETWRYPNGKKHYEVTYDRGKKIEGEILWDVAGNRKWSWYRRPDGTSVWTLYWPNDQRKIVSHWKGITADGPATHYDREGNVIAEHHFKNGDFVD